MVEFALFLLFIAISGLTLRDAWRAGARAYQIDLREAHHQGKDIVKIVLDE